MSRPTHDLKLRAQDDADLTIMSACLQDAILPAADMTYQAAEQRFIMVVNRFCWENRIGSDGEQQAPVKTDERVISALHINKVSGVQSKGFDPKDKTALIEILALTYDDEAITLHFSGGGKVRLQTDAIDASLHDLGEHWACTKAPHHDAGD
ncbi:MAG: DUF2948 family protein [Alphaproteobacteria bacterium]